MLRDLSLSEEPTEEAVSAIADILEQFIDDLFREKKLEEEPTVDLGLSTRSLLENLEEEEGRAGKPPGERHNSNHSTLHDKVEDHRFKTQGSLHHHHKMEDAGKAGGGGGGAAPAATGPKEGGARR